MRAQEWAWKVARKNEPMPIKPDNVYANSEAFHRQQPFFYDKQQMFWFWNEEKSMYEYCDETTLLQFFEACFQQHGMTIAPSLRQQYLNAFKLIGRRYTPTDPPKTWVQFGKTIYDFETKRSRQASPDWFICNPIPWNIGQSTETPVMDKLITEWVGPEYLQTMYELLAYCCVPDYPLHTIFCFVGSGRNGKSKMQQIIKNFVGLHNIASTDLDSLSESRFESSKLYKKTVCLMGETDFGILKHTGRIKRLTGQDLIGYEFKNKMPFDGENYAKLIISSNSLPSTDDTSDGWYRRFLIIDFPNEFAEGKDVLKDIPLVEYENLANKCVGIIPTLLSRGYFNNNNNINNRKERYMMASNPLPLFLAEYCEAGNPKDYIPLSEFTSAYQRYLKEKKRRIVKNREIELNLSLEGVYKEKLHRSLDSGDYFMGWAYLGIRWKKHGDDCDNVTRFSFGTTCIGANENNNTNGTFGTKMTPEFVASFWDNADKSGNGLDWLKIAESFPDDQYDQYIKIVAKMEQEGALMKVPGSNPVRLVLVK